MEAFFIIIAIVVFVFFIVDGFRSHSKKYGKGKYRNDSDPSPTGSFFWRDSADGFDGDGGGSAGGDGGGGGGGE
ncbi:hypothetical protein [Bacillus litorisediminis]|uniref:hypothetical protein n=1 Tax=Bacillus litorisediminis TaxID=2922713 RepID=UPI001FAFD2DD|nr:hypothetical protein [Bacillus litorisediminis]